MGFNIAGLVINKNYDKDINQLGKDLKWGFTDIEEITLEKASENWTPKGELRVYFSDAATMIFFNHEMVFSQFASSEADTLNYAYSATAMAFQVDVFEKGKLIRSIYEYNHEKEVDIGDKLPEEVDNETADGLTFTLIDKFLGEEFGELDYSDKAYRFKLGEYIKTYEEPSKKVSPSSVNKPTKKWWEFWK